MVREQGKYRDGWGGRGRSPGSCPCDRRPRRGRKGKEPDPHLPRRSGRACARRGKGVGWSSVGEGPRPQCWRGRCERRAARRPGRRGGRHRHAESYTGRRGGRHAWRCARPAVACCGALRAACCVPCSPGPERRRGEEGPHVQPLQRKAHVGLQLFGQGASAPAMLEPLGMQHQHRRQRSDGQLLVRALGGTAAVACPAAARLREALAAREACEAADQGDARVAPVAGQGRLARRLVAPRPTCEPGWSRGRRTGQGQDECSVAQAATDRTNVSTSEAGPAGPASERGAASGGRRRSGRPHKSERACAGRRVVRGRGGG
jgi:hypothetical protein